MKPQLGPAAVTLINNRRVRINAFIRRSDGFSLITHEKT